jgi:2-(1,2-epoxy-1,2-dihydrophenyl)acetyl-CoA isomerase
MHEHEGVAWGVEGGIGRIVLHSPEKANSIGPGSAFGLARAIDEVLAAEPRVILLTAQGPIFCAGGDIGALKAAGEDLETLVQTLVDVAHPAVLRLSRSPAPVISAIGGAVGGAGVGIALCADIVLGAESMKLRTGYAAIGLSPDLGASYFLARRIGTQKAKRWLMLSDAVDARHCLEAGVIDALHADSDLSAAAEALALRLAGGARGSLAGIKLLCDGLPDRDIDEHFALERTLLLAASRSADAREGVAAFLERRAPRFSR